jgi:hypothetical protein
MVTITEFSSGRATAPYQPGAARSQRLLQVSWGNAKTSRFRSRVEPTVPDSENEIALSYGKSTRQVYGVCSSEGVLASQSARLLFDSDCQFNRTHRSPIVGPGPFRRAELLVAEVTVTVGSCQRCSHLGIGQSTRHRGVASIPELDGEVRARLFYQELHEGTGVEVDERHSSASLLADYVGQRPARSASDPPGSAWTSEGLRWGYQPIRHQPLQSRGRAQPLQACHGDTAVSDTPRSVRLVQLSPIEAVTKRIRPFARLVEPDAGGAERRDRR